MKKEKMDKSLDKWGVINHARTENANSVKREKREDGA
jgi:hypothetical protein